MEDVPAPAEVRRFTGQPKFCPKNLVGRLGSTRGPSGLASSVLNMSICGDTAWRMAISDRLMSNSRLELAAKPSELSSFGRWPEMLRVLDRRGMEAEGVAEQSLGGVLVHSRPVRPPRSPGAGASP